ncbi:MAG: hypothetical protein U0271_03425 [Polyangiaceae bacterium]
MPARAAFAEPTQDDDEAEGTDDEESAAEDEATDDSDSADDEATDDDADDQADTNDEATDEAPVVVAPAKTKSRTKTVKVKRSDKDVVVVVKKKKRHHVKRPRTVVVERRSKLVADDDIDPASWDAFNPYPSRRHFSVRFAPRFSMHSVNDVGFYGGGLELSIGADNRNGFYGFYTSFDTGRSDGDLGYGEFDVGVDMAWTAGPFHFGLRPTLGYFGASQIGYYNAYEAFKIGIGGVAGIDVYRSRDWTVGFQAEPRVDLLAGYDLYWSDPGTYGMYSANFSLTIKYQKHRRNLRKEPAYPTE